MTAGANLFCAEIIARQIKNDDCESDAVGQVRRSIKGVSRQIASDPLFAPFICICLRISNWFNSVDGTCPQIHLGDSP